MSPGAARVHDELTDNVIMYARYEKGGVDTALAGAEIADERNVHADIFIDFRGIDFDVDLFCGRGVGLQISGYAIVEAHAERE